MKDGLIIENDGTHCWYDNGELHREDGPAVEKPNNHRAWFKRGKLHREDGSAIEYYNVYGEWTPVGHWYYHGKRIDCSCQEEFERLIKIAAFW